MLEIKIVVFARPQPSVPRRSPICDGVNAPSADPKPTLSLTLHSLVPTPSVLPHRFIPDPHQHLMAPSSLLSPTVSSKLVSMRSVSNRKPSPSPKPSLTLQLTLRLVLSLRLTLRLTLHLTLHLTLRLTLHLTLTTAPTLQSCAQAVHRQRADILPAHWHRRGDIWGGGHSTRPLASVGCSYP